jgi:NADP-dependent 3-hydroxy acid dehydrogenase YdfG
MEKERSMSGLEGQVVMVTGAGTGIGRATAEAFAGEGCRVALVGRRPEPLEDTAAALRGRGGDCLVVPADVSDTAAVEEAVAHVLAQWGRVDVLVNNAGTNVARRGPGRGVP